MVRAALLSLPFIVSRARSRGSLTLIPAPPFDGRCVLRAVWRVAALSTERAVSRFDARLFDAAVVFAEPLFVALLLAVLLLDPLLLFELLLALLLLFELLLALLFFAGSFRLEELFFFLLACEVAAFF